MKTFLDEIQVCNMTKFSGALNNSVFDGNTILLKISEDNCRHKYVYIGGYMVCSFMTIDIIYEYISNMRNVLCAFSLAKRGENYYLLAPNFKFIKKDKTVYDTLLDGMYPCEEGSLQIHSNYV